jgi:cell division protein FtsA
VDEIFDLVAREFERAGFGGGRLPAGVVLTGGTTHMPGMVELAREAFALPVRAGTPEQGIAGLVDSVQAPRYAVAAGLVLYAARRLAQGGPPSGSMAGSAGMDKLFGPLKRWLQDFF